jgi:hypothetical protein
MSGTYIFGHCLVNKLQQPKQGYTEVKPLTVNQEEINLDSIRGQPIMIRGSVVLPQSLHANISILQHATAAFYLILPVTRFQICLYHRIRWCNLGI